MPRMTPVQALDWAVDGIADAYGPSAAEFVAMQVEYPAQSWKTAANAAHQLQFGPPGELGIIVEGKRLR